MFTIMGGYLGKSTFGRNGNNGTSRPLHPWRCPVQCCVPSVIAALKTFQLPLSLNSAWSIPSLQTTFRELQEPTTAVLDTVV